MKIKSKELLNDLAELTKKNIDYAKKLLNTNKELLEQQPDSESWNALECIEHLNRYGDFYIPELKYRIDQTKYSSKEWFSSNMLGNYFANMMKPVENSSKMKTFKKMNPINSGSIKSAVIDKFIDDQNNLLKLLDRAYSVDIQRTKTSISISKLIKLKIGDTFRVVIYHNERHLIQALKAAGLTN